MKKFASRKLFATTLTIVAVIASSLLGLPIDEGSLTAIVTLILGYVGSQGLVDTAEAWKTGQALADGVKAVKVHVDTAKAEKGE